MSADPPRRFAQQTGTSELVQPVREQNVRSTTSLSPGESGARWRIPVTYTGPTTMGTPTARRASQAGSGSFFGPERLAVPPHHAGVNVDDEPPARRVARVAADRPRVGHAGTGC